MLPTRAERTFVAAIPYLRLLGAILSIAGIALVARTIWQSDVGSVVGQFSTAILIGVVLMYALANACQGLAWISFIGGDTAKSLSILVDAHGRSVVTKYIPGGIFQFVSRQLDLAGTDRSQKDIAIASTKEIAGLVVSAVGIIIVGGSLGSFPSVTGDIAPNYLMLSGTLLFLIWLVCSIVLIKMGLLNYTATVLYIIYFLIFEGIGMVMLSCLTETDHVLPFGNLTSAWLLGYVVIGSPGGIGVREWAIVALLRHDFPVAQLAAFAVAFRLVCILGDGLYWAVTRRWR